MYIIVYVSYDRIVVGFTTLCDKVCQWLPTGRWFSPGTLVSSTNETDRHVITEILLKVALNTIKQTKQTKQTNHFTPPPFNYYLQRYCHVTKIFW